MRPVSSHDPLAASGVSPSWARGPTDPSGAARTGRGAGAAAVARAAAVSRRDAAEAAAGSTGLALEALLGKVPSRGARGLAALLPPPPEPAPRGVVQFATALRRGARRAGAAGGAGDLLGRTAAADPNGTVLQAAIACEQRLGQMLERLGSLQDQVTAAMTAVSSG
jgi:hypothetical protein